MINKTSKQLNYLYINIVLISILGFIITSVLPYPYGIGWDDYFGIKRIVENFNNSIQNRDAWLGWFYPTLWKIMQTLTNLEFGIGVFNNLCYWISMPIIYVNLFSFLINSKKIILWYNFWYIVFAFSPFMMVSLMNVYNSNTVAAFLLLALMFLILYSKNQYKYYFIASFTCIILASLIRRDAILFAIPILLYLGYLKNKKWWFCISIVILAFISSQFVTFLAIKSFGIKEYYKKAGYSSLTYIMWYDIVAMSYHKKELLIPDEFIKTEYLDKKNIIMDKIVTEFDNSMFHDVSVINSDEKIGINFALNINPLNTKIENSYQIFVPIYIRNVWYYIIHRFTITKLYLLGAGHLHSFDFNFNDINNLNGIRNQGRLLVQKIAVKLQFLAMYPYILMNFLSVIVLLYNLLKKKILKQEDQDILLVLCIGSLLSFGVLMLAVTSIQIRYMVWYVLISWIGFIFLLSLLSNKCIITHNKT